MYNTQIIIMYMYIDSITTNLSMYEYSTHLSTKDVYCLSVIVLTVWVS